MLALPECICMKLAEISMILFQYTELEDNFGHNNIINNVTTCECSLDKLQFD